jgi:hypothetical protein
MSSSQIDSIISGFSTNSSHNSVCITSIIRLYTLKSFGLTADPTWDNIPVTLWTTLETTTAVVCTCLPSIRAGLLRVFPTVFGTTTHPSTSAAIISKNTGGFNRTSTQFSVSKSWPAKKLPSIASISIREEEEAQSTHSHKTSGQVFELERICPRRLLDRS